MTLPSALTVDAATVRQLEGLALGDSLTVATLVDPVLLVAAIEQWHPGTFSFTDLRPERGFWRFVVRR